VDNNKATSEFMTWLGITLDKGKITKKFVGHLRSVWPNKKPPWLNTLSTGVDVQGTQKVLSNDGFRMANCFCCLS